MQISVKRRMRSGGNSWVEMSLVILPFFALITAFFDVSFALFSWSTLQNAVREGCRYAITFQTAPPSGASWTCNGRQDNCIQNATAANSMGLATVAGGLIRVNYFSPTAPNTPIAAPNGNAPGNIVEVSIQGYPLNWMIPLSGTLVNPLRPTSPTTINVYSSDVLGGYPAGTNSVAR